MKRNKGKGKEAQILGPIRLEEKEREEKKKKKEKKKVLN
jgi:hypothetical protein